MGGGLRGHAVKICPPLVQFFQFFLPYGPTYCAVYTKMHPLLSFCFYFSFLICKIAIFDLHLLMQPSSYEPDEYAQALPDYDAVYAPPEQSNIGNTKVQLARYYAKNKSRLKANRRERYKALKTSL